MNWIEWKGEKVGSYHDPVCVCLVTNVHPDWTPVYAIMPRAFCWTEGDLEGKGWTVFEGDTTRHHLLPYIYKDDGETKKIYDPAKGDKIFYCRPLLPDGSEFDLNDIKKRQFKGSAVVKDMREIRNEK